MFENNVFLLKATFETLYMVFVAGLFSIVLGLGLGSLLYTTAKQATRASQLTHRWLSIVVNVFRSIPFIILLISLIPLTRLLVGTTIGTLAAIVPLTVAAIPFFARISENALLNVPAGLSEAALAMGASRTQLLWKVLIPESLPALIRGGTLTLIALIGYSAMAGAVGGGGLGELAINYGYQRFDFTVMMQTVVILVLIVQALQMAGDYCAKHRLLTPIFAVGVIFSLGGMGYQCWPAKWTQTDTLRVGVMAGEPEVIMQVARLQAKEQYHLNLEVVPFSDYVQPNVALDSGSIDANIFQHLPYLEGQISARHFKITPIAKTFVYPMGFYSQKLKSIWDIPEGGLVAIPNDPSNGGRALLILQKAGLIALKPNVGVYATINDITSNSRHLQFKLLDAAQLPRVLRDADLVAITNDFVGPAGLSIKQALIKEGADSPYANLIVVRKRDKAKPILQKLITIMHSQPVVNETKKIFPDGAAIEAWAPANKHE